MARLRVLLVEDDRAIRESLVEAMTDEGFDAAGATDGLDALLRRARETPLGEPVLVAACEVSAK